MSLNHFPFYPGDYLRDTMRLTLEQDGAYHRLINSYWDNGGPIFSDDKTLARLVRVHVNKWRSLRPYLVGYFVEMPGGLWRHKRIEHELKKARDKVASGREGGIKSTIARQAKPQANWQAKSKQNTKQNFHPLPEPESVLRTDKDSGSLSTRMPRASPRPLERRASAQAELKAEKARRQGNGAADGPPAEAVPLTEAECLERAATLRALAADIAKGNVSATGPPPDGTDEAKLAAWRDKPVKFSPAAKQLFGARVPREPGG